MIKKTLPRLGLAVVVGLVCLGIYLAGALEPLERATLDARYRLRALLASDRVSPHILVVAIDDRSLAEVGSWPWDRRIHAMAIDALVDLGAEVIAFDVLFEQPAPALADRRFKQALARAGNVILPARAEGMLQRRAPDSQQEQRTVPMVGPLEDLAFMAAGLGHVNVLVDPDGVVRRVPLVLGRPPVEALGLSAYRLWKERRGEAVNDAALASDGPVPVLGLAYRMQSRSTGGGGRVNPPAGGLVEEVSYVDVIRGRVEPDQVQGRMVFVGLTAAAAEAPQYLTPHSMGPVPGVYVHAATAATLLHGPAIRRIPPAWTAAAVFLMGAGALLFLGATSPVAGLILLVAVGLAYGLLALGAFLERGLWVDVAGPWVAGVLAYATAVVEGYRREMRRRQETHAALARYVSPRVAEEILRQSAELDLGGVRRPVSVLFADLRGFTSFAEGEDPQWVMSVLNRYLSAMADAVFAWGGTLCKYTGDGIMALFGAPVAQPDHALKALRAAHDLRRRCQALARRMASEVSPARQDARPGATAGQAGSHALGPSDLAVGIGVASGEAVVGNVGSPRRVDYSAIGDVVNVAARLEEKAGPWEILVTRHTAETAAVGLRGRRWLRSVLEQARPEVLQVAGRQTPLSIYRLPGKERLPGNSRQDHQETVTSFTENRNQHR